MVAGRQIVDSITLRLLYDRAALKRKVERCDKNLNKVHWAFLEGLFAVSFGIFLIWLVMADVTLLSIGPTSLVADPVSFGLWGAMITLIGLISVAASIHIKICYPTKLRTLNQSLNELDDLLLCQLIFPRNYREKLGQKYHVHYYDYLKEWEKIESVVKVHNCMISYCFPGCFVFGGLYAIAEGFSVGHMFEATIVGGLFALFGIVWILFNFKRQRKSRAVRC